MSTPKTAETLKNPDRGVRYRIVMILNIVFTCIYLAWRLLYTIPLDYGAVSLVAGLLLFIVEFFGMLEAAVHYFDMNKVKNDPVPVIAPALYPEVDVFVATYNEPKELLYKTLNGCLHMEYPDKSKVHIWLCDDGRRAEMRELAAQMGVGYIDREDNAHAKAGNLNHAMSVTSSPYVVTMDADMIPRSCFLLRTIPYFIQQELDNEGKEEKEQKHFGFVQSPQAFYNPDLFQFNLFSEKRIPNEQDYFYRDIQVSRNRSNSVIYGGSNTVLSRRALEDVGGFYTGSITEDYATGILMQKKGYIGYAVNEVLASGLSPTDMKSLVAQRIRWARGVISSNRKLHTVFSPKLSFVQKANYWASEWYWFAPIKRLVYFMSPILYAVFGYMVVKCTLPQILLFWLPMYITSNMALRMLSRNIRTTKWTSVYETVLFPFLLIPVLLESIGISTNKFSVTKKGSAENEKGKNVLYLVPFLLLIVLSVIGIVNCVRLMFASGSTGPIVVLGWLVVNLFTLVMSLFFLLGRDLLRKSERVLASEDCEVTTPAETYTCKTADFSETGLAVQLDAPVNIDDGEAVSLHVWNDRYDAKLRATIVHTEYRGGVWKTAFAISDYGDTYDDYLQLIYDRVPTLPQSLDNSSGSFDDVRLNITRRAAQPFSEKRKLPRFPVTAQLPDGSGRLWKVTDFNYRYLSLPEADAPAMLVLTAGTAETPVALDCVRDRPLRTGGALFRIVNEADIRADAAKNAALEAWVRTVWQPETKRGHAAGTGVPAALTAGEKKSTDFDEMAHV